MSLLWLLSVRLRNAGIVDAFWGASFVLSGWYYFVACDGGWPARKLLAMVLVTIWGLRLSLYLLWRNHLQGSGAEDFRYQAFRRRYGPERYWWVSFFQVFLLQGVLSWLIGAPLLGAQRGGGPLGWLDLVALAIWALGFVFEAGADLQLARFRARRRPGELLTSGFWRYTRHPNYFGDAACWWAYGLFSVAAGAWAPALGALLMTALIIKVSGVALLERSLIRDKPGYAEYARRTSAFIPWPPRSPGA
ncbi:MAG: DUF1295 domain-containing protein [Myxococcales bacterium]|nr:DUF1295 domain-containing protein [Myxococcales bacterium]